MKELECFCSWDTEHGPGPVVQCSAYLFDEGKMSSRKGILRGTCNQGYAMGLKEAERGLDFGWIVSVQWYVDSWNMEYNY